MAGMAAATLVAEHQRGRRTGLIHYLLGSHVGWVLFAVGLAVALPLGASELLPKPVAYKSVFHAVFGLVVAALLVRIACLGGHHVLTNRALAGLGVVSYSLYLWHWAILSKPAADGGRACRCCSRRSSWPRR